MKTEIHTHDEVEVPTNPDTPAEPATSDTSKSKPASRKSRISTKGLEIERQQVFTYLDEHPNAHPLAVATILGISLDRVKRYCQDWRDAADPQPFIQLKEVHGTLLARLKTSSGAAVTPTTTLKLEFDGSSVMITVFEG